MHGRLTEVTSATELAATDILDGLGRTLALVEDLDAAETLSDDERHRMLGSVREELNGVVHHLQFQDVTAQQLAHIASLLEDMRARSNQMMKIFAPQMVSFAKPTPVVGTRTIPQARPASVTPTAGAPGDLYDPHATMAPSDDRQAIADEIFAVQGERKTA
jgi:hypothetical protein